MMRKKGVKLMQVQATGPWPMQGSRCSLCMKTATRSTSQTHTIKMASHKLALPECGHTGVMRHTERFYKSSRCLEQLVLMASLYRSSSLQTLH